MTLPRSILIAFAAILFATPASAVDDVVWQLRFKEGHPINCTLFQTRVAMDDKGQTYLEADSCGDKGVWHSCITLPKGLLKAGEDYVLTFDYEVVKRTEANAYFYAYARSNSLGYGADQTQRWSGESGTQGVAKLRISPTANDFIITVGICNQGAIRVRNMKVIDGNGWAIIPLATVFGNAPLPATPTGAQPFTVDPPANPNGPVLNLADFGAVPDGDAPPSAGPDRNLAAFRAAIAKCLEVKASKLVVPKGIYRITSGDTIIFDGLTDFTFDGGGSTFLFHQIKGGAAGVLIKNCTRAVFSHFNLDWDWKIDPLASVGRILKVAPDSSYFEMQFETMAPLDPKRWITMNPLDEKLRAPGVGQEIGVPTPKRIESLAPQTVRVWPAKPISPKIGQLYLLRHYTFDKDAFVMSSNKHLSMQDVAIYSFPGNGFQTGGDQDHIELLHCRITYPPNERRSITLTAGGFMLDQSHGFIKLEDCDFGYLGDDCVDIHDDNTHLGVRRMDDHTLVATNIVPWRCPFSVGDPVEIRNGDYSPTDFTGTLKEAKGNYKTHETTLIFEQAIPSHVPSDAILYNHRYATPNCIIRNCYFHENRARGVLCNSGDCLIEGNHFFHNQHAALHLIADIEPSWGEGFGARNVIVRNNTFESSNPAGAHDGAAVYVSADINNNPSHYPLLENLLLENNRFQETTGPAIEARSFKNLVIRDNSMINLEKALMVLKMRGSIRAELGSGLWVEGNEWTTQSGITSPSLLYDSDTTQKIVCQGNRLKSQ